MEPRSKRFIIGCGIGCGLLALIAVVLAVSFFVWLSRPGDLLEPEALLGRDTTGYAEWTLRLDDPGTEGFVTALIAAVREQQQQGRSPLPPILDRTLKNYQSRKTEKDIRRLFPMVAAWTLHPGDASDEDVHLFSVSMTRLGNQLVLLDWILGFAARPDSDLAPYRHGNERIYVAGGEESFTFFIRGNDFFFTWDLETATRAVDRLRAPRARAAEATSLDRLYAGIESDRTLRCALTNERGEIGRLWRNLAADSGNVAPELLDRIVGVSIGGNLNERGSLNVSFDILGPDEEWSSVHEQEIVEAIRQVVLSTRLDPEVSHTQTGNRVRVDVDFTDLTGRIGEIFEGAAAR